MAHRVAALFLLSASVLPVPARGQTLDEMERPLLSPGQSALSADYGQFASEFFVAGVDFAPRSYFEPAHHVVLPVVGYGASRSLQWNVSGTYLVPTQTTYALFPGPGSTIDTRWLVKSLSPEGIVRRGNGLELHIAGVTARSRFDEASPTGNATAIAETFATDALQVRGIWLPRPDAESRIRRADLDGLLGPILGRHRAAIRWEGLWRRYRSTDVETDPLSGGSIADTVHSTDARLRLGAAYGIDRRTQLSGDVYWQPPVDVSELAVVRGLPNQVGDRVEDYSRRLSRVFGWRLDERWRVADRLEARVEAILERQSVTQRPQTPSAWTSDYHQGRLSAGATWRSRPRAAGAPLAADLSGLYRPLLEKRQLRLDADLRFLRGDTPTESGRVNSWRVDASLGVLQSVEGSVYVGKIDTGVQPFARRSTFGAGLRFRPSRWLDAYATLNYHPSTWMTQYPAFVLPQGSLFRAYQDLLNTTYDDDASFHIGVRLLVK